MPRWPATRSCAGSWPSPGRVPSASSTAPAPGRCCAATPTPGSPPRNAARPETPRRGSRGAGGRWSRSAGTQGTFTLDGRALRLPAAKGCSPLLVRLDRDIPYPAAQVRSVTLGFDAGRLYLDVTAEVPVATYPDGTGPGSGAGGGGGPGHHPPLRGRRAGRAAAAGVRPGDPRRVPPAAARPQGPQPGRRPPRPQTRAARVAPLAPAQAQAAARRGPAPAPGPAGPARGRQDCRRPGRWNTGPGRWRSATRAASLTCRPGGGTTKEPGTGASGTSSAP